MGGKKGKKKAKKTEADDEVPIMGMDAMASLDMLNELDPSKWSEQLVVKGPCTVEELPANHKERIKL